jgi:hypothetical protein
MYIRNKEVFEKELPNFIRTCQGLLDNSKNGIDIEIKKHSTKRNSGQNSFYWLNCNDIAKFLNDAGLTFETMAGVKLPYNKDVVHEINVQVFSIKTTTKMSVSEFCEYMNKVFEFWKEKTRFGWQELESTYSYLERTGLITKESDG